MPFLILLFFLLTVAWPPAVSAVPRTSPEPAVLYFLSFTCPGCKQITPLMNALADESAGRWRIEGLAYGTPPGELAAAVARGGVHFPVTAGTGESGRRYEVTVTPTLVLIGTDGRPKERYVGVGGAQRLARALRGGLTETGLYELAREPQRFDGRQVTVRAFVVRATASSFALSNGRERLDVARTRDDGVSSLARWQAKEVVVRGTVHVTQAGVALIPADVSPSH